MICPYVCSIEETLLPLVLATGKFCYEVRDDLSFNGGLWVILDVKLIQLYGL